MRSTSGRPRWPIHILSAVALAMVLVVGYTQFAFAAPLTPVTPVAATSSFGVPMTDAQLKASDPVGYRDVVSSRAGVERELLGKVHKALDARGLAYGRKLTARELAAAAAVSTVYSPYGYLRFRLVAGTGDWSYNGYRGTLYFTYGIYNATVDAYKWYTVSWPAISGNNRPGDQDLQNVGPIPEYTWDFGFLGSTWQGYVPNSAAPEFYPGEWRLSPWTGAPYGRCYFETHGGSGTHYFKPTHGCIRLTPANISALKTYYAGKMANKKDRSSAHLTVNY
jgi:hypothetical protein